MHRSIHCLIFTSLLTTNTTIMTTDQIRNAIAAHLNYDEKTLDSFAAIQKIATAAHITQTCKGGNAAVEYLRDIAMSLPNPISTAVIGAANDIELA